MAARKKLDVSFEDIVSAPAETVKPVKHESALTLNRDDVARLSRDDAKALKRAHVSVYVSLKVQRAIKQLALDRNVRAHDLYLDGLRTMMKAHGLDFDQLNKAEGAGPL